LFAADLESQVADLTEANENSQAALQEKKTKMATLQGNWDRRHAELEEENAGLRRRVGIYRAFTLH
jgi:predicted  nucleic acid-binding Zn-ribbon protein